MKKIKVSFVGLLVSNMMVSLAVAEQKKTIYKYTDENGVTHYTETKPNDDYEEADLPQLSIIPSAPTTNSTQTSSGDPSNEEVDSNEVSEFKIIAPVNEQNLWGTGGKLTVKVQPLTAAQSQRYLVQFVVDGKKQKPANSATQVFSNIYRGEHSVQGFLIDKQSREEVKKTQKITFFMHQNTKK